MSTENFEHAAPLRGFVKQFSENGILFAVLAAIGAACLTLEVSDRVMLPEIAVVGLVAPTLRLIEIEKKGRIYSQ